MNMEYIDPSLLYLEVPLYTSDALAARCLELVVNEGEANNIVETTNYDDQAGGVDLYFSDGNVKRTIYWKTHGSSLELFEVSLQANLLQNHMQIDFQNSKVLPGVKIFYQHNQVVILCATLHAAHRVLLNVGQLRRNQSVLSGLSAASFSDAKNNFYFTEIEQVTSFTAALAKKCHSPSALFAFGVNTGNVILLKMPTKGQSVLSRLNQSSRISRIWSGINPWAGSSEGEIISDMSIVHSNSPKLFAVSRDCKIKVWSIQSTECIGQFDLSQHLETKHRGKLGCNHKLRSVVDDDREEHLVSVYVSFGDDAAFINFQFSDDSNTCCNTSTLLSEVNNDSLQSTLVDFQLSSLDHLWALWVDTEDEVTLSVCDVNNQAWHDVALAASPPQEVSVPGHLTVQEAYMKQIFTFGNFSPLAITKALSIHQRTMLTSRNLTWRSLRENVLRVVRNEIQNLLPEDGSASLSDTIEAQVTAWQGFYQSCLQYQRFVSKPLGLTIPISGAVNVVKKEYISHLASVSSLEAMCRGANPSDCSTAFLVESNVDDLGKLLACLSQLANMLGHDYIETMMQSLSYSENPINSVKNELNTIKELMSERLDAPLQESLFAIGDVVSSVNMLLTCLDPGTFDDDLISGNNLPLTGNCGIDILCRVVQRYVNDRLQLSLLLLILSIFFDELQDTLPPKVSIYVQAYSAIKWAVACDTEHVSQISLENTLQTLSVQDTLQTYSLPSSMIEYYLRNQGGVLLQELLDFKGSLTHEMLPRAAAAVVQLMWPLGPTMSFPEFLLSKAQFSRLQHYLDKELYPWCDFCPAYSTYMLGQCHLHTGQYHKAAQTFLEVGGRISEEEVHLFKLLQLHTEIDADRVESVYYTMILRIFEELDLSEHVILIANCAIGEIPPNDPSLPILCSSVFRHSLALYRHNDAYEAIVRNPDPEHRKDCLRAMVVALCDRKEYKTLVEYPYDDLQDDLVLILEHRARCSDLLSSTHKYYDLLFAFHVYRRNYRRAASTMYEQSWRLGQELSSVDALKRKHVCLVSAVTCLLLCDVENRWIVHPVSTREADGGKSPKRDYDGEEVERDQGDRKVVICDLADIQKEILLVEVRQKLAEATKDDSAAEVRMSPQETVSLLSRAGLYNDAFSLCVEFNIPLTNTFQSLATRCVQTSYATDELATTFWIRSSEQTTQVSGNRSASDLAWQMLQDFLDKYGSASGCHRIVLTTLLSYSYELPAWFVNKYKKINCPELIRLLICYDYLEQATQISTEYIDAVMGLGSEHFNIKTTLSSIGGQVWIPYTEFEQLISVLSEMNAERKYEELHDILASKIDHYLSEAEKVSSIKLYRY